MSRTHSLLSKKILSHITIDGVPWSKIFAECAPDVSRKMVYDALFRLSQQGVITYDKHVADPKVYLTTEGKSLVTRVNPTRDGVWKVVIFDISEKQRHIRNTLRSKLKMLGFKKWQESIWISPYALDAAIEAEFAQLAEKFFIRLLKSTDINYTEDLEKLFK